MLVSWPTAVCITLVHSVTPLEIVAVIGFLLRANIALSPLQAAWKAEVNVFIPPPLTITSFVEELSTILSYRTVARPLGFVVSIKCFIIFDIWFIIL